MLIYYRWLHKAVSYCSYNQHYGKNKKDKRCVFKNFILDSIQKVTDPSRTKDKRRRFSRHKIDSADSTGRTATQHVRCTDPADHVKDGHEILIWFVFYTAKFVWNKCSRMVYVPLNEVGVLANATRKNI